MLVTLNMLPHVLEIASKRTFPPFDRAMALPEIEQLPNPVALSERVNAPPLETVRVAVPWEMEALYTVDGIGRQ